MNRKLLMVLTCGTLLMGMVAVAQMRRLQLNQNLNKKKRFRKTESSNHSKAAKDSYVVSEDELSKADSRLVKSKTSKL